MCLQDLLYRPTLATMSFQRQTMNALQKRVVGISHQAEHQVTDKNHRRQAGHEY